MSFTLAGTDADHPVVFEAGLPALPLLPTLKAHIPLTSPERRKTAAMLASGAMIATVGVAVVVALVTVAATRRRRS